jgi:hypothetical protein
LQVESRDAARKDVPTDIDNRPRGKQPDLGADELVSSSQDTALFTERGRCVSATCVAFRHHVPKSLPQQE